MESLDKHFRKITRSAFERHGFAHSELVAQWNEIVGADLAERCRPEKMSWPKGRNTSRQQTGATLSVRCNEGDGLALSYETTRICERVNGFYGYQAVAAVKVVQGKMKPPPAGQEHIAADVPPAAKAEIAGKVGHIEDENLKQALTRLGEGVHRPASEIQRAR